jgi:hypothetical protein
MRCPSCEKMVSYDTEAEVEGDPEVSGGSVTVEARRVLTCADCGEELKQNTFDLAAEIKEDEGSVTDEPEDEEDEEDVDEEQKAACAEGDHDWELVEHELAPTMRTQTHDRKGRPLKGPMRYRKTYYGVDFSGGVKCSACGATGSFKAEDEAQASSFEELT